MIERAIVCDTTVLLYPGRVGLLDVLPALFASVCVPEQVLLELDMGRLLRSDTVDPREVAWITPVSVPEPMLDRLPPNRLGAGERAVIAYAHASGSLIAGLDDLQARRLAQSLNLQVVGTLGVLLRAKAAELIPAARPVLDAVVEQGFRLSYDMYQDVLQLADEG